MARSRANRGRLFWRCFRPARNVDPRRHLEGFESRAAAVTERAKRIEILKTSTDPDDHEVARELGAYRYGKAGNYANCPVNVRDFRKWAISTVVSELKSHDPVWFVTLCEVEGNLPFGGLHRWSPQRLNMRLRRRLERTLPAPFLVIGAQEVDVDQKRGVWQCHQHLLIAGCDREAFEALRRFYPSRPGCGAAMQVVRVENLIRRAGYALKLNAFRKVVNPVTDKARYCRLRPPQLREFLRFMAAHRPTEFLFLLNVRRRGSELVPSRSMKLSTRRRC